MVQLHVSVVDGDVLDMMKDAGCTLISYGLESFDAEVLQSMRKKTTPEQIAGAIDMTSERKIAFLGNFLFGDPAENLRSVNNTLDWWSKHRHLGINLTPIQIYPGTPLYKDAVARGIIEDDPSRILSREVNLTRLDDDSFRRLIRRTGIFGMTASMYPGKAISLEQECPGDAAAGLGGRYRLTWECLRCGAENVHGNLPLDSSYLATKFSVMCWDCRGDADFPNFTRAPWIDPALEDEFAEASRLREAGDTEGAMAGFKVILERPFPPHVVHRPEAFLRAGLNLGMMLNLAGRHGVAIDVLEQCVTRKPFDAANHLAYAMALLGEGCEGAARMYCEQARLLLPGPGANLTPLLDTLEARIRARNTAGETPMYFC